MKVRSCHLPCIVAELKVRPDGDVEIKCPRDCKFATYTDEPGPLDRWLEGEQ